MKNILIIFLCLSFAVTSFGTLQAQDDYSQRVSPMTFVSGELANAKVSVTYSSPAVKERKIWGELVPYGKVWRTGANEATVFETDKDVMIGGQTLSAGKYSLFTIPGETEWTVIFNKKVNQWGAYTYDPSLDAVRVNVVANKSPVYYESLKFDFSDNNLILRWENLQWVLPIKS